MEDIDKQILDLEREVSYLEKKVKEMKDEKKEGEKPLKHHINYADRRFYESQKKSSETAKSIGGFDIVHSFGRNDIDENFLKSHKDILDQERGAGYWLWKPYIIDKYLESMREGDYLFYSDSGSYWVASCDPYIKKLDENMGDIMLFILEHIDRENAQWTNDYTLKEMNVSDEVKKMRQVLATFLLMRNTQKTRDFIKMWLSYCCDSRLLTDEKSVTERDRNCHRHDQSILSILGCKPENRKRYGIILVCNPCQWGIAYHKEAGLPMVLFNSRDSR